MNTLRRELRTAMSVTPGECGVWQARLLLQADFSGFNGHFQDNPVVPGVCLVQAVLLVCAEALGRQTRLQRIRSAKFFAPLLPGQAADITVRLQPEQDIVQVRADIVADARQIARLRLSVCAPDSTTPEQGGG